MPKLKLTKTVADTAAPEAEEYQIRDTTIPGFLLKITPAGRKMSRTLKPVSFSDRYEAIKVPEVNRAGTVGGYLV